VIEQVGDEHEECLMPLTEPGVRYGCGQVSLAAAAGPDQDEPPSRLLGELQRCLVGLGEPLLIVMVAASPKLQHVPEDEAGQRTQVAVPLEAVQPVPVEFCFGTLAGHQPAEIRMIERDIRAQPPFPQAGTAVTILVILGPVIS